MTLEEIKNRARRHLTRTERGNCLMTVKATRRWKYWMNQSFRRRYTEARRRAYLDTPIRLTVID